MGWGLGLGFQDQGSLHVRRDAPPHLQEALRLPFARTGRGLQYSVVSSHLSALLFLQLSWAGSTRDGGGSPAGLLSTATGAPCVCFVEQHGLRPVTLACLFLVSSMFWWTGRQE